MTQGYVWDIEADNLYLQSKEIWIIHLLSMDKTRQLSLFPFRDGYDDTRAKYLEWHKSFGENPLVVSFNGIGYDHWMLWKFLQIPFHIGKNGQDWIDFEPCRILDLWVMSYFVDPDRPRHSLASYGEELGNAKIDFHDFSQYSDEMLTYCIQDVALTLAVYNLLMRKLLMVYKGFYKSDCAEQYKAPFKAMQKDYYLYAAQAFSGIQFDREGAVALSIQIQKEMDELEAEVLPQLPPRGLKEGEKDYYSIPAKPFKKDGSLSETMNKWILKHDAKITDKGTLIAYGKEYPIQSKLLMSIHLPMEISDGNDIKNWFMQDKVKPEAYEKYTDIVWRD